MKNTLKDQAYFCWESSCDMEGYISWILDRIREDHGEEFKGNIKITVEYEEED